MAEPMTFLDGATVVVEQPDVPVAITPPPDGGDAVTAVPVPGPQGPPSQLTESDLARVIAETTIATSTGLVNHVLDAAPHPAYDDLPSLRLLYENGLV